MGGIRSARFCRLCLFGLGRSRGKAIFFTIFAAGMLRIAIAILEAYIPRRLWHDGYHHEHPGCHTWACARASRRSPAAS
jgi:hypothetical protein